MSSTKCKLKLDDTSDETVMVEIKNKVQLSSAFDDGSISDESEVASGDEEGERVWEEWNDGSK